MLHVEQIMRDAGWFDKSPDGQQMLVTLLLLC